MFSMKGVSGKSIVFHEVIAFRLTQNAISTRLIIFYTLAASVTIMCNILDNPALPSAVHDYELLKNVQRLMSHMSMQSIEGEERLHRDQLESFVRELLHAAERATSSMRETTPSKPSLQNDNHIDMNILDGLSL